MKKILLVCLLLITMVVSLAACGGKDNPPSNEGNNNETPVHTHSFDEWEVTVKATCTENGTKVSYCSCGEKQSEVIVALGHTPAEAVVENKVDATCEVDGNYNEVVYCSKENCKVEISREAKTIAATGHYFVLGTCENCGEQDPEHVIRYSEGLEYVLSDDGTYYILSDIGTCTDRDIVIPLEYNGLPIKEINPKSEKDGPANYCPFLDSINDLLLMNYLNSLAANQPLPEIPESFYGIDSITMFGNIEKIASLSFCAPFSLQSINVVDSEYFSSSNGVLYSADKKTLLQYPCGKTDESFSVPSHTESIEMLAFMFSFNLKKVEIPEGFTSIPMGAFGYCVSLENVSIPNTVTYIAQSAFVMCPSLKTIIIPKSVKAIESLAFMIKDSNDCSIDIYYEGSEEDWADISIADYYAGSAKPTVYFYAENEPTCEGYFWYYVDGVPTIWLEHLHTHSYQTQTISPTCTDMGYTISVCDCGDYYVADYIQALGHSHSAETIAPSCTEQGYTEYTCHCGDSYIANYVQALGHNYIDGVCTTCGYEKTSEGLAFTSNGDGTCYVSGIGSCTDTDIVIPSISPSGDRVTMIGTMAFSGCSNLVSVIIPEGVTMIGGMAFSNCSNLVSVTIPDGITKIDGGAFYGCGNLENAQIPNSVTYFGTWVGYHPFEYCNKLLEFESGIYYVDNWAIDSEREFSTQMVIREGTVGLASTLFGFNDSYYTAITIPDGVTIISDGLFSYCSNLKSVYITDITQWCKINFGSSGSNPLCNGADLYINGELVTDLVLPDSVTSINDYAFYGCTTLTSIVIPDSVTIIGSSAFSGCHNLANISVDANNEYYQSISGNLYTKDGKILIRYAPGKIDNNFVVPNGVTNIDNYAFSGCGSLTSIVLPDSVTNIGSSAFSGCSSLTSIVLPDSVASIGSSAFSGCSSLTSIILPDNVTNIGNYAFYQCTSLTYVVIPNSVTTIGDYAFESNDYRLRYVYYTGSEEDWNTISIGNSNYGLSYHNRFYYSETAPTTAGRFWHYVDSEITLWPSSSLDFIYTSNGDGTCYISGIGTYTDTDVIIPNVSPDGLRVVGIGDHAFSCDTMYISYYIDITSVYIPEGITTIESYAFSYCKSLKEITIPNSVTSIGYGAFSSCSRLTSVVIPDSVTSIGDSAFSYCSGLTSVVIGDSVTSIGGSAFSYCSGLTSVVIGESVTSIGECAFYNCTNLSSVVIPNSVTSIDSYVFNGCNNLTDVYYTGTEEEWKAISIDYENNAPLKNATIHYNYIP